MTDDIEESLALHKRGKKNPAFVYLVAVLSALGGLLYGYDTGVVSGAMILLRDTFKLDKFMQGVVVSVTIITAWVFCLLAGNLTDRYGRKIVIICASVVFILGSVLMGVANDVIVLIIGRVVVGMGIGLASMCVPMYIAEVSPPEIRGILVNINNCSTTFGQFLASLVSGAFSGDLENGWRYMLGIAGVPAIFQFICFMFMPESPRWLIHKGKYEDAKRILQKLRGSNANIETEFDAIKSNCDEIKREHSSQNISVLRRIFQSSSVRKALFVGCSLLMFQQLAGINTVMYYSATIIEMSGVKSKSKAIWLSSATSAMNFVCSLLGLVFVERVGRRILTLASLSGVILSLTLLAISFQLADHYSPALSYKDPSSVGTVCNSFNNCGGCIENADCGYCFLEFANGTYDGTCLLTTADDGASKYGLCNTTELPHDITWAYSWCPSSYSWMTFMGLLLYLFFFTPGMGCMPPLVNSEIYPLWARGTCYSIATSVSWLSNFVISLTFLELMQVLTKHGAFFFYDSLAISGLVFIFLMLPETKGVSLEEVENLFTRPWWKGTTTSAEKKTTQYALRRGISNTCADED